MDDNGLDNLRNLMLEFDSFEDFHNNYIKHYNLKNINVYKEFYKYATSNDEAWTMYKFFRSNKTINLHNKTYNDVDSIINEIKDLDLCNFKRIIVRLDNKTYKDISKLKNLNLDVLILLNGDKGLCTIDEFIYMREFFDFFRNEYSKYNLSELEKVTICYDYTKFFLYNKENSNLRTESRSIAKSLSNGHIVCEGYAKIFSQLLSELNIDSNLMYVYQNHDENKKHVRAIVFIKDEKYELDDYFIFDPTWDSYDENIESQYSTIKYNYYLINIKDYNLYFKDEDIYRMVDYKKDNNVNFKYYENPINFKLSEDKFNYLIRNIKRVEGYSKEQIEEYIKDINKYKNKTMSL